MTDASIRIPQLILRLLLVVFSLILLVGLLVDLTDFGQVSYVNPDHVSCEILYADGGSTTCDADSIPTTNPGDTVIFHVMIPEHLDMENPCLVFYQYHSVVAVTDGSTFRREYGRKLEEEGRMIGDRLYSVPLPERSQGHTVTVSSRQVEGYSSNHITAFRIMDAGDTRLYPLIGSRVHFILYGTILILSLFAVIAGIIDQIVTKSSSFLLVSVGLFCFTVSVWQLSYRRLFYLLIGNEDVCAVAEYISTAFAPVPVYWFLGELHHEKKHRRIYRVMSLAFLALFIGNCLMNYVLQDHFPNREMILYVLLAVSMCIAVTIEVFLPGRGRSGQVLETGILRAGIIVTIILLLAQFVLIGLRTIFPENVLLIRLLDIDLPAVAMLVFIASLVAAMFFSVQKTIAESAREEQAKHLAYHDLLTGIWNRTWCEEQFDSLDREPEKPYAVIFFDADHLKMANDTYGHEMGDALIRTTAENIASAVPEGAGFACRWGGDEFLAVITDVTRLQEIETRVLSNFRHTDAAGQFPFPYSVSFGTMVHAPGSSRSAADIRNDADEAMYRNKMARRA